ncbi:thiamine/thiamine pyrophosphate ABC transporter permease ThiP [Rhodovulum sp. BSW8]|uniref:Thiamine transport system permease protein n=3 Tax=Rhodovulum visakhapatnamense TaxID=364297 RepID=A0A4R8FAB1_9RHOB|nr:MULTISPECIES: thiamine/thiamine pyrophosphate ABC transporter permease ThiP [Rhodovulum]MBL3569878.1 thiamine/thiamine pyrophosphate ABC transporter permease ThiP [Rhodovulum visakhapatnamense]OLS43032.1 thiamine/thiamine pyrophosphate ABC transporter permease ThiP [Rhodovulum sulfidophilum]RBO52572.1 thiamine/thiamine pyrophosphate ABC transporter permease ThiP [Rhodovulum sp. BSW8]TDX22172.1 thiamine transport system permease protein [Rhodovulum visakhapatnamense]
MARRAQPLGIATGLGLGAAAVTLALALGTIAAVAWRAEGAARLGAADLAAVRFTLLQALASAALSTLLAVPVARALARRRFPGRGLLITLLGAPFILPVIVAAMGLLAVFGRNGLLSAALAPLGLGPIDIYGPGGVVLAHVFFNLPLATRLVLQGWLAIPAERFRLAAALGFGPAAHFAHIERPMLREVLPGTFLVVFLICLTSFAVALTLGGGPRATTVELAIYQAFRFDFDLGRAAWLALIQVGVSVAAALAAFAIAVPGAFGPGLGRPIPQFGTNGRWLRLQDGASLTLATLFLILPLVMVAFRGLPGWASLPASVYSAALRSLAVALGSAALTLALALPMAIAIDRLKGLRGRAVQAAGTLTIAASPLVMGTGLFILLYPLADPRILALPVTATVNAAMSLPFALRALVPAVAEAERNHGRLADSLGMAGRARLKLMLLPRLRRPIGFTLGLSAALSMGDLGVIALFSDPGHATLPLQLYGLMAAYRMDSAAAAALLLLALSLGLFWIFDRGGRAHAEP